MSSKTKVIIPNFLTSLRLILTPIIIILGNLKFYKVAICLIIIACITDLFDGRLARRWNTVTEFGAKLDAIADKFFAIGLIACLISKFNLFAILLIMEIIIGLFNLYSFYKTKAIKSLRIGKCKTALLFVTVVIGFSILFFNLFKNLMSGFIFATLNLQILSLISYIVNYYDTIKNKEIEESIIRDKHKTRSNVYEEPVKEVKKEFDGNTKVLNHLKDIFLDND